MPHKPGTILNGIRTVEDMRTRCVIDEETGCWNWTLACCAGVPKLHYRDPVTGAPKTGKGRRVALILATGKQPPKNRIAYAKSCCTSVLCVNPDHARLGTKAAWGEWLSKSGLVKNLPSKSAAARRAWDTRGRKLDADAVRDILHSEETHEALGQKYGVSGYAVWSVKNRRCHVESMAGSSVWTWRP